jgi:GMP synthase-like glutamine amidotransferase
MNILIIDNGSRYLSELIAFAKDSDANIVTVIEHDHIDYAATNQVDFIFLSGSPRKPVAENPDEYTEEIELIRNTSKPILGICMGFEIIAYAYGCELERMHNKESRILELAGYGSPILDGITKITVPEHHRWHIKTLCPELSVIARSKDGVEIIKVHNRPIYGFQFHPELDTAIGIQLVHNIYKAEGLLE